MQEWVALANKFGIGFFLVGFIVWFWYREVWPGVKQRWDARDKERRESTESREQERREAIKGLKDQSFLFTEALRLEREDNARRSDEAGRLFMDALRTQNVLAHETHKELVQKLNAIDDHIKRNGK